MSEACRASSRIAHTDEIVEGVVEVVRHLAGWIGLSHPTAGPVIGPCRRATERVSYAGEIAPGVAVLAAGGANRGHELWCLTGAVSRGRARRPEGRSQPRVRAPAVP